MNPSIQVLKLNGNDAFYNQQNYKANLKAELASPKRQPIAYACTIESRASRIGKTIFSILCFPVGIYQLLHGLAGYAALPASLPRSIKKLVKEGDGTDIAEDRKQILNAFKGTVWKHKRITIEVDGYKIDAMIAINTQAKKDRWILASNGNNQTYESLFTQDDSFHQLAVKLKGNVVSFNCPGVGASSGFPTRSAAAKAYRAMLKFLEEEQSRGGLGAKEIIGYGHSIGGAIQGEAVKRHEFKNDIKYVLIKSRTFAQASKVYSKIGFLIKAFGWNISSAASSKQLTVPEIILQTADVEDYKTVTDIKNLKDDGTISVDASLAKALLEMDSTSFKAKKKIIGIPDAHNAPLSKVTYIAIQVEKFLK